MVSKLVILWLIFGIIALTQGWKSMHAPENEKYAKEQIRELAKDWKLPEHDGAVLLYFGFFIFGIIVLPYLFFRKVIKKIKEKFNAK